MKIFNINTNDLISDININYTSFKQDASMVICIKEDTEAELKEIIIGTAIFHDLIEVKAEAEKEQPDEE